jgi:hypothetical protein
MPGAIPRQEFIRELRLQRARWQDLEQLERNRRKKGMQKGIQQGKQLGAADMLLRQITRRFGPPSDLVRERISQVDSDTLMQWSERIFD